MMTRMTVCILNWKRPENVVRIIRDLRNQDAKPHIFLWDNSPYDHSETFDTDWTVKSSENKRCWPRWFMGSMAQTDYIMSLDDDLTMRDPKFISDLISVLDTAGDRVVGIQGVLLRPGKLYFESNRMGVPQENHEVDIVKGRLLSFRTLLLKLIDLDAMRATEDDIAISGMLGQGMRKHWIVPSLRARTLNLPDPHALWQEEGHFKRRDDAVKVFFPWHIPSSN
jgi:hypothetical protein